MQNIRRKKKKNKKRIRQSTKTLISFLSSIIILVSIILILKNTIILEKNESQEVFYKLSNSFNQKYNIALKKNQFLDNLDIAENTVFISELIDNLNLTYSYIYTGTEPEKINYTYKVTGKWIGKYTSGGEDDNIWTKSYSYIDSTDGSTTESTLYLNPTANINISQYYDFLKSFTESQQISISSSLYITFDVNTTAYKDNEMIIDKYTNTIEISIGDKTTEINAKSDDYNESNKTKTIYTSEKPNLYIIVVSVILIIISLRNILYINKHTRTKNTITNMFKIELNQILSMYNDKIVQIDSMLPLDRSSLISLMDFSELIKLSEETFKPILYYNFKQKKEAWFILKTENATYRYILRSPEKK